MSIKKKNGATTNNVQEYSFPIKEEKTTFLQIFYNGKEGTYFGRTPQSWGRLWLFYAIFYLVLAGLFTICLQGLFASLSSSEPKWKLDSSLIGTNPGLGFRPLSDVVERGSIIQFDTKKPEEGKYWIDLLNDFFNEYKRKEGEGQKFCSFNQTYNQDVCMVDTTAFGPCSPNQSYGYKNGRPCVFLKLNRIYGWEPIFYDDPATLPANMPASLKAHISSLPKEERKQVWVSCDGLNTIDREQVGQMRYYPQQGFPAFYYPFTNQRGYASPLVAVQFEKLAIGEMVNVECRAWAKNIVYSGSLRDRQGSVVFQLVVD